MVYKEKILVLLPKPHNSKNPNGRTKPGSRNKTSGRYKRRSEGGPIRASGRRRDNQPAVIRYEMARQARHAKKMGWRENPEKRLRLRGKQSVKGKCAEDVQPTLKETVRDNSDEDECENKTIERIGTDINRRRKGAHARPRKFRVCLVKTMCRHEGQSLPCNEY